MNRVVCIIILSVITWPLLFASQKGHVRVGKILLVADSDKDLAVLNQLKALMVQLEPGQVTEVVKRSVPFQDPSQVLAYAKSEGALAVVWSLTASTNPLRGRFFRFVDHAPVAYAGWGQGSEPGLLGLDPQISANWLLGLNDYLNEAYAQAVEKLQKVPDPAKEPWWPGLFHARGECLERIEQYDDALTCYNTALRKDPTHQASYFERGYVYYQLERLDEAIGDFNWVLEKNPNQLKALYYRANCLLNLGRPDDALLDLNRLLVLSPKDGYARLTRGKMYTDMNRQDDALRDLNMAVSLLPNEADVYFHRGFLFDQLGSPEKALADFSETIRLTPNESTYYYFRADILVQLDRYEEALADYASGLKLSPEDVDFYLERADLFEQLGQSDLALKELEAARLVAPENGELLEKLAMLHEELAHFDEALDLFDQAKQFHESPEGVQAKRDETESRECELQEALLASIEEVAKDPSNAYAISNLGLAYSVLGRLDEAIENFNAALTIDQDLWVALLLRARAFKQKGAFEDAEQDLERLAGLKPEGEDETFMVLTAKDELVSIRTRKSLN